MNLLQLAPAAFVATNKRGCGRSQSSRGRGHSNSRGRGRGRRNWVSRCYFCREEDHDIFDCSKRFDRSYERNSRNNTANLAEAFSANCHIANTNPSDWFLDTGFLTHVHLLI